MSEAPREVLAAWGWQDASIAPLDGGLINATFVIGDRAAPTAVLQRLHPVFGAKVNLDLEAEAVYVCETGTKCFEPAVRDKRVHNVH